MISPFIVSLKRSEEVQVRAAGGARIRKILLYCLLDIRRKKAHAKERLHQHTKIRLPYFPVRFDARLMAFPGFQMRKLMNGRNKKCKGIQIVVNRNAMPPPTIRRAIIAKLRTSAA